MLPRLILIFAIFITSSVAIVNYKKCCPEGQVVQVDYVEDNNLSPRRHFGCVTENFAPPSIKNKRQSDRYQFNNSTFLTQIIGYNVLIDENSHWPACSDNGYLSHFLLHDSEKASQSTSCVDAMNSRYFIFKCDESMEAVNDFVDVYKLRKCCDKYFSYDIFTRKCVYNNKSSIKGDFSEFLGENTIVFESGIPECKQNDVLIEYHSLIHELKIFENSLMITRSKEGEPVSKIIVNDSFCIEATMNSDIKLPEGTNPQNFHLKATSKWVAKVCQPDKICEFIPCVRKCCKEGKRMVFEEETYCEDHDAHLDMKFHYFDLTTGYEFPDPMEPTGEDNSHFNKR